MHKNVIYNCRVIVHDRKILLIRPKMWLANDGNYRELRYFTPWLKRRQWEDHYLPRIVQAVTNQVRPACNKRDVVIDACESRSRCLSGTALLARWIRASVSNCARSSSRRRGEADSRRVKTRLVQYCACSPHILMGLDGVEIFTNSSGSHHELRKLNTRVELIKEATLKVCPFPSSPCKGITSPGDVMQLGGVYLYANQQGCDGDRLYYDGCAMIALNGRIIAQGSQFSLSDVEVVSATIDIEDVRAHRTRSSRSMQAAGSERYHRIEAPIALSSGKFDPIEELNRPSALPYEVRYHTPEEEIA